MQGLGIYTSGTSDNNTQGLYDGTTSDTDNMYYHNTSNTSEEIELPEIPTPKQVFERAPQNLQPKRRTIDKRARSMKFTQARVRRA